jgi:hypothetical protein
MKCDYEGCYYEGQPEEFEVFKGSLDDCWYACPNCVDKVIDQTGYCGVGCMFGYGCDQSC